MPVFDMGNGNRNSYIFARIWFLTETTKVHYKFAQQNLENCRTFAEN